VGSKGFEGGGLGKKQAHYRILKKRTITGNSKKSPRKRHEGKKTVDDIASAIRQWDGE